MRICHLTSAHLNKDERIFYKECSSLAKAGFETYLVARGEDFDANGIHVIGAGQPSGGRLSRMLKFTKRVYKKALNLNAEIYHIHDPELLPYALKLKKHGKKVIFDSHEDTLNQMSDKTWIPAIIRPAVSLIYRNYAKKIFRKLDALVSVTPHIVDSLKNINPNTFMITNYPPLDDLSPVKTEKQKVFSLCFTGGIDCQWCHRNIIQSIEGINDICYVMCGIGNEKYLDTLRNLKGWEKVEYLGKLTHEKAKELQYHCNVGMALLRPSNNTGGKYGTLGNTKLFEYMMNKIPIICTDFTLWNEITEKYRCGICVNPEDTGAITDAIKYIMNHPKEAHEMGENGRRAVEAEFNWSTQEKKLIELYNQLV